MLNGEWLCMNLLAILALLSSGSYLSWEELRSMGQVSRARD